MTAPTLPQAQAVERLMELADSYARLRMLVSIAEPMSDLEARDRAERFDKQFAEARPALIAALTTAMREQFREGMERAAVIADEKAKNAIQRNIYRGRVNSTAAFASGVVEDCASAIREVAAEAGK